MRKKYSRKMLSKAFIDDSKALKTLKFSDWLFCLHSCTKKCIDFFPLQAMVLLGHQRLFLSVDFISGLIAMNFLALSNHKLGSSETYSGFFSHEHRVIKHFKFLPSNRREVYKMGANSWLQNGLNLLCRI